MPAVRLTTLALKDPNSSRHYADINEDKILAAANQFVSLGLAKAGYQYVNIDVSSTPSLPRDYILLLKFVGNR